MDRFTSNGCAVIREEVESHYDKAGLFQRGVAKVKETEAQQEGGVSPEEVPPRSG